MDTDAGRRPPPPAPAPEVGAVSGRYIHSPTTTVVDLPPASVQVDGQEPRLLTPAGAGAGIVEVTAVINGRPVRFAVGLPADIDPAR